MPGILTNEPKPLCMVGLTPKSLLGSECDGASSFLWSFADKPVGSAATIANPALPNTTFLPDIAGLYRLKFCCFYDSPGQVDPGYTPITDPQLGCPVGAVAGEEIDIPLINCPGTVVWSASGAFVSVAGNNTGATVVTNASGAGSVTVTATCTTLDQNNQPTTQSFNCTFTTYDPIEADLFVCTNSPVIPIDAFPCGSYCECAEREFIVKLADVEGVCEVDVVCITVKDCPPAIEEICE